MNSKVLLYLSCAARALSLSATRYNGRGPKGPSSRKPCWNLNPNVGKWGGKWRKQFGSMNEESQVRGGYNITFICTNQETVWALSWIRCIGSSSNYYYLTTCYCRDTGGKRTRRAQRTSFNTLDNWGHKTPTQSKRKRTGKKRLKGHGPKHIQYTRLQLYSVFIYYNNNVHLSCAHQRPGRLHDTY